MSTAHKLALQHWQTEVDADNIFWARFARADSKVNTLNVDVMLELEQLLAYVAKQTTLSGIVLTSTKAHFILGADISQFDSFTTTEQIKELAEHGQAIFAQIAALTIPTVALIQGLCLGGGMELALACDYRIATDEPHTKVGLPEIKLGLHPGWGGTVRLPRLIGPLKALSRFILSGSLVSATSAQKLGVIDAVVATRQLFNAARYYIKHKPSQHKASITEKTLSLSFIKPLIAKQMRNKVAQRAQQAHYPAPYAVIDNWQEVDLYTDKAFTREAESFARLMQTSTAKNLLRVYHLQNRLKELGKGGDFHCQHVHVIGAGTMGGDIAAWCALQGMRVTLQDRDIALIAPAIKRAAQLFSKKLKVSHLYQAAMDRLMPDVNGNGIRGADVIIEAIIEDLAAKRAVLQTVEQHAKPDALLATNTSSIPLDDINTVLQQPQRLVGVHFFNPVAMMQLVEVVQGEKTAHEVQQQALAFVQTIGRLPLPVQSRPGFLVNRVLMPYLMECMQLSNDGIAIDVIDKAAEEFGMPIGPIELADNVGLDICLSVAKNLSQHYGGEVPHSLAEKVAAGQLGRKTGQGFYHYQQGKVVKKATQTIQQAPQQADIIDRLIFRIVNEAAAVLREGVVADADLLDAGMIFGSGFAPFRGGPVHYARSFPAHAIENKFKYLTDTYGKRFTIDTGMAKLLQAANVL